MDFVLDVATSQIEENDVTNGGPRFHISPRSVNRLTDKDIIYPGSGS